MQLSTEGTITKRRSTFANTKSILNTVLLVFLIILIAGSIGGFIGFQLGKKAGAKQTVKKVTDLLNPLNAVSDNPLFPQTTLGKVVSVNSSAIKVKLANGDEKQIPLTTKTVITQQEKVIQYSDIKKDNQVTIFTTGKDKEKVANRIVVR